MIETLVELGADIYREENYEHTNAMHMAIDADVRLTCAFDPPLSLTLSLILTHIHTLSLRNPVSFFFFPRAVGHQSPRDLHEDAKL